MAEVFKQHMSIIDKLKTLPEITDNGNGYKMVDTGAIEVELGEFLYGLVRVMKPKRVLTTGVYTGISDLFIAGALKENGFGHTDAIEFESRHIERAKSLWMEHGVNDCITAHLMSSLDFKPHGEYELMFLDTEPDIRFQELVNFYPHLAGGGFVGIHDLPRNMCQGNTNPDHPEIESWPFGNIPDIMKVWLTDELLVKFHLPSPRGMVWFYKPREDDYAVR